MTGTRWGTEMSLVILIVCRGLLQVCGMLNTREGMLREGKKIRVCGQMRRRGM
jgi:hypothetical protein